MKYTILMGSPNRDGNTAALLRPFVEENQEMGIEQDVIWLYERDIKPCRGCKACQNAKDCLGCVQKDEFQPVFDSIQTSDVLVLATPIYSWFCTPPMKAVMDRLIYAGCKYYGAEKQPSAYWMKQVASITTCGYKPEYGADLWEEALKRWCKHGEMDYLGMYCRRDTGKKEEFMDEKTEFDVRDFAHALYITVGHSM
ncbi:flavodoxin family protein [Pseudoflavonifractor phocaeensis]|uniref:flavodoxin family protein n=1 Tax=Pseudoflavonifractor phocaeensis TaxID=1870988 RepID=UPI001F3C9766|nr:flavodoxin family protein [Pseudoflavonifractor phocaeensis]MCF2661067.1 flavodoxin family protein [Pseudoflavonifractor phocaeensis]